MCTYHVDGAGNKYPADNISAWNESVTISVNQEPNYLDPENVFGEEKLYTLKIRNANPTNPLQAFYGIPVLPTLDPWILTFGAWEINVEGEFVKFEVQDIDNEVHPDPIFGHAAQVYVRREERIRDKLTNSNIGDNLPIKFSFMTGTFIAVPPGKIGVGDREGDLRTALGYVDESKGWKKI